MTNGEENIVGLSRIQLVGLASMNTVVEGEININGQMNACMLSTCQDSMVDFFGYWDQIRKSQLQHVYQIAYHYIDAYRSFYSF